jgi:hypothetical protein
MNHKLSRPQKSSRRNAASALKVASKLLSLLFVGVSQKFELLEIRKGIIADQPICHHFYCLQLVLELDEGC